MKRKRGRPGREVGREVAREGDMDGRAVSRRRAPLKSWGRVSAISCTFDAVPSLVAVPQGPLYTLALFIPLSLSPHLTL